MGAAILVVLAVFAACAVEMVEALTIVLATGTTRGWRSTAEGAGVAVVALAALVAALGPALVTLVPLNGLRVVIGGLLLVLGLQWLRKAVLRASGHKARRDESALYTAQVDQLTAEPRPAPGQRDATAFTVSFKGVFLEGVEVVMIVLTLGTSSHRLGLAVLGAAAAVVVVGAAGALVARRLGAIPENAMKMGVGVMLVSFGTFWSGEGLGIHWPGSDLAIPVLIAVYGACAAVLVSALARSRSLATESAV